jgi:hypothetical protein
MKNSSTTEALSELSECGEDKDSAAQFQVVSTHPMKCPMHFVIILSVFIIISPLGSSNLSSDNVTILWLATMCTKLGNDYDQRNLWDWMTSISLLQRVALRLLKKRS